MLAGLGIVYGAIVFAVSTWIGLPIAAALIMWMRAPRSAVSRTNVKAGGRASHDSLLV